MMWSELDWNVQAKRDGSARWKWPTTAVLAQTINVAISPLYPLGLACDHREKELSSAGAKVKYWCRYALRVQAQIIPTPIQRATRRLLTS